MNRQSSRSCRFVTWTRRISWSNCPHWNIVIWDWVYEASFKRKNRSNHWPFNMKSVKSVLLKLILTSSQKLTEWKKFAPLSTLERIFLICAKTILHTQIITIPFISKYLDPYTEGPRIVLLLGQRGTALLRKPHWSGTNLVLKPWNGANKIAKSTFWQNLSYKIVLYCTWLLYNLNLQGVWSQNAIM